MPPYRTGHYILQLGFFLSFFFFPRLFSQVADWMSTILKHMMAPYWEFRMQAWNVLHAACWKYRTQKFAIYALSHNFIGISLQLRHVSAIRKNLLNSNISSTCPQNTVNFGPLTAENLLHPSKFQWVSCLGFVTALTSLNGGQPNFARCLAISWAGAL